jgi:hypothetical protein
MAQCINSLCCLVLILFVALFVTVMRHADAKGRRRLPMPETTGTAHRAGTEDTIFPSITLCSLPQSCILLPSLLLTDMIVCTPLVGFGRMPGQADTMGADLDEQVRSGFLYLSTELHHQGHH